MIINQFALYAVPGLCFTENVLDNGFSGFWIVTDCVPPLPASVLSFSDIALAVCSSFRHGISPFRNEQYRNQGNKATEKRNCYQKVIICPSEPRRPIFAYCGAISALPGRRSSLVTAVRFSNGQEALFIDYSGAKYARSAPKIALTWKSLFRVVENSGFLNRLRNGHLEKSAVTGLFRA